MTYVIKSFSRRIGRKLRPSQKEYIKCFLPTINLDGKSLEIINLDELFDSSIHAYELEIGFGSGEHMIARALDNLQTGYIGCEPYLNGVARALSLIKQNKISNIKIYSDDAGHIINRLENQSINQIWILFPDPWPKKRHHIRRIINQAFLAKLSRILKNNGRLVIATDHEGYAKWILEQTKMSKIFELNQISDDLREFPAKWYKSKYQLKAEAQGLAPFYFEFEHICSIT